MSKIDEIIEKYLGEDNDNQKMAVASRVASYGNTTRTLLKRKKKKPEEEDSEEAAPAG